ncbi:MAG: transporter substrate-binding protein [Paenibacillus sp.]|nr:transporter substrate-binding protein [Paenibacillus sp.]
MGGTQMNTRNRKRVWLSGIGCSMLVPLALAGCSKSDSAADSSAKDTPKKDAPAATQPVKQPDPVTVRIHISDAYGDDAFFKEIFADTVKAKYPYITLERVKPVSGETAEKLAAASDIPDLLVEGVGLTNYRADLKLASDLTELAKKHKFDWGQFKPVVLDAHKSLDGKQILGMPWNGNLNALYYNKDIFDKFGVPYPKDGMFWNDVMELAKKVSRVEGGTAYYGYDIDSLHRISFPLSLTVIDIKTNKASINTDQWRKVFQLGKDIYSIAGNNPPTPSGGTSRFMKDRNQAMVGTINLLYRLIGDEGKGINWDVVQYPSYPERPNIFGRVDVHNLQISQTSKHKDEAFLAATVIASQDVQTKLVRKHARYSPLNDPDKKLMSQFADDVPELKSKNVKSIFKSDYAPFNINHRLESTAFNIAIAKFNDMVKGKDINTALREAEEEINKMPLTQ